MIKMALLVFLFLFSKTPHALAYQLSICGEYELTGKLEFNAKATSGVKRPYSLIVNRDTDSETVFHLSAHPEFFKLKPHQWGTGFKVKLKLLGPCWYQCEADLVDIIDIVDPIEGTAIYTQMSKKLDEKTKTSCSLPSIDDEIREALESEAKTQ